MKKLQPYILLVSLVDYNNDTYISFMGEDRVIVGFSNSTIMNGEGFDIEFILQIE